MEIPGIDQSHNVLPLEVLCDTPISEENLIVHSLDSKYQPIPEIEKRIKDHWPKLMKFSEETKGIDPFFNGTFSRLIRMYQENNKLVFETEAIEFKDRMGVMPASDLYLRYGFNAMPKTFTGGSVVITKAKNGQEKIPIEIRSKFPLTWVVYFEGLKGTVYHEPAGFFNVNDGKSMAEIIRNLLNREILNPEKKPDVDLKVKSNELVGVIYNPNLDEIYCCFSTETDWTWEEVYNKLPKDRQEAYVTISNTKKDIKNFLESSKLPITSHTRINLTWHLINNWEKVELSEIWPKNVPFQLSYDLKI